MTNEKTESTKNCIYYTVLNVQQCFSTNGRNMVYPMYLNDKNNFFPPFQLIDLFKRSLPLVTTEKCLQNTSSTKRIPLVFAK